MMRMALLLGIVSFGLATTARAEDAVRNSVVHIRATQRAPNFFQPWTKGPSQEVTGTGFVIDGKRILTNAHVVRFASQIYVQPHQSARKVPARVAAVATGIDLAVLEVDDEEFFKEHPALSLAEGFPQVRGAVNVYGYPVGGEEMSVTEGIISRVEFASYREHTEGLRIQIDAALNPGNSGGPAVSQGKVVGVAFSMAAAAENIGYLIPIDEVQMFLDDITDGKYDGKPQIFDSMQTVENDALRAKLGLPNEVGGAMVTRPSRGDDGLLKENDVITKIGDHVLDNDCKVQVSPELQLSFRYYVPKLAKDGKVPLSLFRSGETSAIDLPVSSERQLVVPPLGREYPRYFIYGPLVFSPACVEMVAVVARSGQAALHQRLTPLVSRLYQEAEFDGQELVLLCAPMFSHRITRGYDSPVLSVLESVNGVKIKNLKHLVEVLRDCQDAYVQFVFAGNDAETLIFRRAEITEATEEILADNGIRKQFSADLEEVWSGGK